MKINRELIVEESNGNQVFILCEDHPIIVIRDSEGSSLLTIGLKDNKLRIYPMDSITITSNPLTIQVNDR